MIKVRLLAFAIATTFIVSSIANASVITWMTSVDIDDLGTFVDTNGTLVAAINADDAGDDVMIGGVNFLGNDLMAWNAGIAGTGGVTISSDATEGNFGTTFIQGTGNPPGITDADITNIFGSAIWNPQTVTLDGLISGSTYRIQIIGNDSRNGRSTDFITVLGDGTQDSDLSLAAGTAGLNQLSNSLPTDENPRLSGDAIIGTFIADATGTQTFSVAGSNNGAASNNAGARAQINGIQLRVVPEPGTGAISLLGLVCLAMRRRKVS